MLNHTSLLSQGPREQFRITGRIAVVDHEEKDEHLKAMRVAQWESISQNARFQFLWPHPGRPRDPASTMDDPRFSPPPPNPTQPEDTFALLILEPTAVDHLSLRRNERCVYTLDKHANLWNAEWVNP